MPSLYTMFPIFLRPFCFAHVHIRAARWSTRRDHSLQLCNPCGTSTGVVYFILLYYKRAQRCFLFFYEDKRQRRRRSQEGKSRVGARVGSASCELTVCPPGHPAVLLAVCLSLSRTGDRDGTGRRVRRYIFLMLMIVML
ncbi:hypothetical protein F5X97DRAFT_74126 [Nemania serpens]|nr:hypothetical protein F5X97DRAFT_74126 [Nemania serpens]